MKKCKAGVKFKTGKSGQAMAEYIIIVCLIALTCIGGIKVFEAVVNRYYERITVLLTVPLP
jgi:Flp pilus assembly pilin Flp